MNGDDRTTDHRGAYLSDVRPLPLGLPAHVRVNEVGPRDGLQLEKREISTDAKIALVDALSRTGVERIQVTSFVRPDAVPQLADADAVMAGIERVPGVAYTCLVPNLRGAQRALPLGADGWDLMLSCTESHSVANSNKPTREVIAALEPVVELGGEHGIELTAGVATSLGCPFEGRVPYQRVLEVMGMVRELGVRRMALCDTVGVADPGLVHDTCSRLRRDLPDVTFGLHLHDTRSLALPNVLAGLAAGVTEFDATVGGLGGCPFAPGASGNVATEDLVHMLTLLGISTGIDLDAVLRIAREQVAGLVDHPLESSLARSGPSWTVHTPPRRQVLPRPAVTTGSR